MKIIKNIILSICIIIGCIGVSQAQVRFGGVDATELDKDFPRDPNKEIHTKNGEPTDLGDFVSINEDKIKVGGRDTIIRRLLEVFGLDNSKDKDLKFIDYLKAITNLALGLVSFIALIMSIYTFYLILFSDNEAGVKKAKGNLIGIFIALAIIGLAWLIVSLIFRRYQSKLKANEDKIGAGNVSYLYDGIDNEIYLNTLG